MIIRTTLLFYVICLVFQDVRHIKPILQNLKLLFRLKDLFFAGSNSLIGELVLDMPQILEDSTFQEIEHVSINEITVEILNNEELTLDQFTSAALQLVSDENPMTSIAIMNPIQVSNNQLKLTVSGNANVDAFFKTANFQFYSIWIFKKIVTLKYCRLRLK